jgi:SpoVK/Ycf46/Vps4 family AAA+-type ATPase
MATNFQERFDAAIKRAGRFDLLICMGPPMLEEKITKLSSYFDTKIKDSTAKEVADLLHKYLEGETEANYMLQLFTYGDFKSFLKQFGGADDIVAGLKKEKKQGFISKLNGFSESIGLRYKDLIKVGEKALDKVDVMDADSFTKLIDGIKDTTVGQFLRDRRESRRQY